MNDPIMSQYYRNTQQKQAQDTKKVVFNQNNYLNTKLAPNERERQTTIRLLNVSKDSNTPFETIFTHFIKVGNEWKSVPCNKKIIEFFKEDANEKQIRINNLKKMEQTESVISEIESLNKYLNKKIEEIKNYEEKYGSDCPMCALSIKAYEESKMETNEVLKKQYIDISKSHQSVKTYIVRLIERTKEGEGVKFWKFNHSYTGKGIYDSLIKQYSHSMVNDKINIFDLVNGCDLTLTIGLNQNNKSVVSNNIMVARSLTPIGSEQKIKEWVNDEKVWYDVFTPKTSEYCSILLTGEVPIFDKNRNKYVGSNTYKKEEEERNRIIANDCNRMEGLNIGQQVSGYQYTKTEDIPF